MKPIYHFSAPHYWINDPNGCIYYNNEYHIFYQHYPYAPYWGTMHWGHYTTQDFITYHHHPIALYPSKDYDRNGCFSGTALIKDEQLYLYYTAIKYAKENPEYVHIQYSDDDLIASQALMISKDGYHFDNKNDKHLVVDVIRDETLGDIRHTRDPKVWLSKNNQYIMAVGSKVKSETGYSGEVLFYVSDDGLHFTYKNRYLDDTIGDMWECPDLFELDGQWFMIFSPEHINQPPQPVSNAVFMPIEFDEDTCTISSHQDYTYLDYGLDFYAPQTFLGKNQERMMIGWLRMRQPVEGEDWVGMHTMPRILTHKDGHLYQEVIPQIKEQFNHSVQEFDLKEPMRMKVTLNEKSQLNLGGLIISIENDCLKLNRQAVSIEHPQVCHINQSLPLNHQYDLEIYYDYHVFEIFINNGLYVMSQIVYGLTDEIELKDVNEYQVFKAV